DAERQPRLDEPSRPAAEVQRSPPAGVLCARRRSARLRVDAADAKAGAQIAPAVPRAEIERYLRRKYTHVERYALRCRRAVDLAVRGRRDRCSNQRHTAAKSDTCRTEGEHVEVPAEVSAEA